MSSKDGRGKNDGLIRHEVAIVIFIMRKLNFNSEYLMENSFHFIFLLLK